MSGTDGEPGTDGPPSTAALADLITVMDRLRSPGGCPWDAEQTHASLLPYAIEEVHEVVEAVEAGDRDGMREELGDLLLQVVFHARVAQEHPDDPFDLADVATGVADKLRRRHPHVFSAGADGSEPAGADEALDAAAVHRRWETLKQAEKQRASAMDGIPPTLPALARAGKVLDRARRAGLGDSVTVPADGDLGDAVLALVASAGPGVDPEAALRAAVRRLEGRLRVAEHAQQDADPGS